MIGRRTQTLLRGMCIVMCVAAVCGGVCTSAFAAQPDDTGKREPLTAQSVPFEYELDDDDNVIITKYTGSGTSVTIPSSIDGHTVTEVGTLAFDGCAGLRSVALPSSLRTLGAGAFRDCDLIASVTVPASLEECSTYWGGGGPFYECDGLKEVLFAQGCRRVAPNLLNGCPGIESVTVPEGVTEVGDGAFASCEHLSEVSLPSTLTKVGESAFSGCKALASVSIPANVTEIGRFAFEDCTALTSISFPDALEELGGQVCYGCTKLTEAHLPAHLETIPGSAFGNCSKLAVVSFPNSLQTVGNGAFENCAFTQVELPTSTTSIWGNAFKNNDALTKVVIPNSVIEYEGQAFYDCDALTDVKLGTGLTEIPYEAFRHCDALTEITIPYRVESIDEYAFAECISLSSIFIPRSVTSIADNAFSYPDKLTIYGVAGTYAETYANDMGITFEPVEVEATSIVPTPAEVTLLKDEQAALAVTIEPANFTGKVAWKTTNSAIAIVDTSGVVTAVGVGTANIRITVGNKSASVKVTVVQPVEYIDLNEWDLTLEGGQTAQLTAEVGPDEAGNKEVIWQSSDETIATVDEAGLVTAHKRGSTTITCTAADGSGCEATCDVTVTSNLNVVTSDSQLESTHPYGSDMGDVWQFTENGATSLSVTFDDRTSVEEGVDYLYIFDADGNEIGSYTGSELAGQTVEIPGNTVKIKLVSDDSYEEWGFKVTKILAEGVDTDPVIGDKDGWVDLGGGRKGYARGGKLVKGWMDLGASKFYFLDDGAMATGWTDVEQGGKVMHYYFHPRSGNLVRGTWMEIGGRKYYFRPSGNMATGFATIDDNGVEKKYYLDESGQMLTGWQDIELNGKMMHYYFRPSGALATGWATIDGEKYYFRASGNMATGWADVSGSKHYFDAEGRMLTGWQEIGGKTYYFRASGAMQTGTATIDGVTYTFSASGVLVGEALSAQSDAEPEEEAPVPGEDEGASDPGAIEAESDSGASASDGHGQDAPIEVLEDDSVEESAA